MNFAEFKNKVHLTFRLDLNSYKEKQLKRRLDAYVTKLKFKDYQELYNHLTTDRKAYEQFLDHLTINVSEFFRDPKRFEDLEKKYLPELFNSQSRVNIWSAACSNGSEPYSMAIILEELGLSARSRIEATDIDRQILKKAETASYHPDSLKNVGPTRLSRFFTKRDNLFLLNDVIKRRVSFRYHDLLADQYKNGYDLIVCRNVTIYFTREAQDEIYFKFNRSLNPGGILFIGSSEMIFNYKELGYEKLAPCFYKKAN